MKMKRERESQNVCVCVGGGGGCRGSGARIWIRAQLRCVNMRHLWAIQVLVSNTDGYRKLESRERVLEQAANYQPMR